MSTNKTEEIQISRRYASAVFALAVEAKSEAVVVADFMSLSQAIGANAALEDTLVNPLVTAAQKADVLAGLAKAANPITQRALATIAEGGRADVLVTIAQELKRLLATHQGEIEAVVTSAEALPAATQKQLAQSLANATGKKVSLALKQDASVLGGLMIELGSMRLDATLSGALNTMRQQLLATTN